jgi:hypothetical protein
MNATNKKDKNPENPSIMEQFIGLKDEVTSTVEQLRASRKNNIAMLREWRILNTF